MSIILVQLNLLSMQRITYIGFGEYCGHCACFASQTNHLHTETNLIPFLSKLFHDSLYIVGIELAILLQLTDRIIIPCL